MSSFFILLDETELLHCAIQLTVLTEIDDCDPPPPSLFLPERERQGAASIIGKKMGGKNKINEQPKRRKARIKSQQKEEVEEERDDGDGVVIAKGKQGKASRLVEDSGSHELLFPHLNWRPRFHIFSSHPVEMFF